jgi:hypothetical protein
MKFHTGSSRIHEFPNFHPFEQERTMQKYFAGALKLSALSLALLAAGCTGGSDSSDESMRVVEGTAAKGIIKGARVQAFSVDADGKLSASPLAISSTGVDGAFTLNVPTRVLNFILLVDAAPGATMADEATGTDVAVPDNMSLRSMVTLAADAGSYSGAVTPLTELVAKTAEKSGGLTKDNVAKAKQGAREAFGFDPETVKPVNANSDAAGNASEEQKTQALLLAALSKLAKDGALGCAPADIKCIVIAFANSGSFSGSKLVLGSTGDAFQNAINAVVADPVINRTGRKSAAVMPDFTDQAGVTRAIIANAIEAAKKLFASLRTNMNIFANNSDAFDLRIDAVNDDLQAAVAPLDLDLMSWVRVTSAAIDHLDDYKLNSGIVPTTRPNLHGGSCSITQENGSATTSAATAQKITCVYTFKHLVGKRLDHSIVIRPQTGGYSYSSQQTLVPNQGVSTALGATVGGTIVYTSHGSSFASVGDMPARTDAAGNLLSDLENWTIGATRAADGSANAFKYAFNGTLISKRGNSEVAKVVINPASGDNPGSYARVVQSVSGVLSRSDVKEINLSLDSTFDGSKFKGTLNLNNWLADKSGVNFIPSKATFTGSLDESGLPFFSGTLTYEQPDYNKFDSRQSMSATNFLPQTVGLNGKIAMPQRPELKMSAAVARSAFGKTAVTGQYDDGAAVVNFAVNSTSTNGVASHSTSISSVTGVAVAFTNADEVKADPSVPVVKDSAAVAVLNLKTGKISYADGSFESLK